ncbi:hypothetical protein L3V82_12995, partial [Thiotrichales bacterium 19S3-7]|nr:hypothetical protein [Thiotrichales bacterium 19S3-7]MCF6803089.1 hypothetical protein [Thiotrichales bacterium 19S3-11]
MPFYHHSLYFQLEQSSQAFKDSPPGTIDVNRLIQGKSNYWVDPNSELSQHKKTLIFSDWLAFTTKNIQQIKKQLNQLLLDGFSIYIWHENQLKLLNSTIIAGIDEAYLSQISQVSAETIENQAFSDKKIPKDQLHILSPIEFQRLLNKNYQINEYPLHKSTLYRLITNEALRPVSRKAIKKANLPIKLIDDVIIYGSSINLTQGISTISTTKNIPKKTLVSIKTNFDIKAFLANDLSKVKHLELIYCNDLTNDELELILKKMPNLVSLKIHNCQNLTLNLKKTIRLKKLQTLDISNTKLAGLGIYNILKGTPNLNYLKLKNCAVNNLILPTNLRLSKLSELEIQLCDVNEAFINNLLCSSVNLQSITLYPSSPLTKYFTHSIKLSKLKIFRTSGNGLRIDHIENILRKSRQLVELSLYSYKGFNDKYLHTTNFSHIKKITLTGKADIANILKKLTNVETINTIKCEISETYLAEDISLTKLESLDLISTKINLKTLAKLLSAAPNLKKLQTLSIDDLSGVLTKTLRLPKLEVLDIDAHKPFQAANLNYLLKYAVNLKKLRINKLESDPEKPISKRLNLTNLVEICFSSSKLSNNDLLSILTRTSKLEALDLSDCLSIKNSTLFRKLKLTNLKSLSIKNTKLNDQSLNLILKNTNKLTSLNIQGCTKITGDCFTGIDLSYLTTFEFDEHTALTEDNLLALLERAPNLDKNAILDKFYNPIKRQFNQQNKTFKQTTTDANVTFNKNKALNATKIFSSPYDEPHYSTYRLAIYQSLEVSDKATKIDNAFKLMDATNLQLINTTAIKKHTSRAKFKQKYMQLFKSRHHKSFYLGRQKLNLTDEFIPIASLSTHEQITDIFISNANYKDIEIKYSKANNLYYIRSKGKPKSIQLNFILKKDPQPSNTSKLPKDVIKYCQYLSSFDSAPEGRSLKMVKKKPGHLFGKAWPSKSSIKQPTGRDYLDLMSQQKLGACRHRAVLFKDFMEQKHPEIPTRIVHNDVHAYIEVCHNKVWRKIDLGGYVTKLEENHSLFDSQTFKETHTPSRHSTKSAKGKRHAPKHPKRIHHSIKHKSTYIKASAYFASKSVTDKSIDTLKLIQAVISDEKNKTHLIELDHSA